MSFNLLDLAKNGEVATATGVSLVNLEINPGPDTRIYLYLDASHDDATSRTISIATLTRAGRVLIGEQRLTTGNSIDRVIVDRPIVVKPGGRIAAQADVMGAGDVFTLRGSYVTLPESQTLQGLF